jgi:peptidoglycan/LPS O-acetylase OafA/YrhL
MELRRAVTAEAGPAAAALPRAVPAPRAGTEALVSVQLLRAFAALAVVVWHLSWVGRAFPAAAAALSPPRALAFGYAGVDLFFVISGFIISYITWDRPFAPRRFALRRFFRIAPLYALFTALAVSAVAINSAWDSKGILEPGYVLSSFLIVPMEAEPYLGVGWSLEHEFIFYALAGAALAAGRARWLPGALALLFAVGVVLHAALLVPGATRFDFHLFSPFHFQFLVGVAVFRWRAPLRRLGAAAPLALGAAGFALTSALVGSEPSTLPTGWLGIVRVVGYGAAAGLLLVGGLNAEAAGWLASRARAIRALWWVGEASFVLYLSHFFVYSILAKVYARVGVPDALALPALVVALLAAVGGALAFHASVERPFLAWARRRF